MSLQRSSAILPRIVAVALAVIGVSRIVCHATDTPSCTIFTVAWDDTVLFGNNEDHHSRDLVVGFQPRSAAGYGSVHLGTRHADGSLWYAGAVNEQGLAWDVNSAPREPLNPHPERPRSHAEDNFLTTITKRASTVAGAIQIAKTFDFGDAMAYQIHIADATGDAVIIGAGANREVAFTRISPDDGYLVSTNFNRANYDTNDVGWRYETAMTMLSQLGPERSLTPEYARGILNAVHLNMLTTYTLYSNVIDLGNEVIYLNYMAQYGETIALDIAEELAKGERVVDMRELFSTETSEAGDLAYLRFERRFTVAKVIVIGVGVALCVGVALSVARAIRARLRRSRA